MDKARSIPALVLLMAAAFLIGLALSQFGHVTELSPGTEPAITSAPAESSAPESTEASTSPPETTAPPETAPATKPPKPTKPAAETTSPPETTPPPETAPPETTVPDETEPEPDDTPGYTIGALEYAIGEEINRIRAENGLSPLPLDPGLCAVSYVRACELNQLRAHVRPDGRACESVLSDHGYPFGSAADLLFFGTPDASAGDIVAAWQANPESQTALLDPAYTVMGAAVFESGGMINVALFLVAAPENAP